METRDSALIAQNRALGILHIYYTIRQNVIYLLSRIEVAIISVSANVPESSIDFRYRLSVSRKRGISYG